MKLCHRLVCGRSLILFYRLCLYFIIYFHFLLHSSTWLKKRYKFDPTASGGDRMGWTRQFCFINRFVFSSGLKWIFCVLSNLLMRLHNVFRNVTLIVIDIFIFFSHCFQLEIARSVWGQSFKLSTFLISPRLWSVNKSQSWNAGDLKIHFLLPNFNRNIY